MKNITSFYIRTHNGSGVILDSKEAFLEYLSEEIDRIDESGKQEHFDITIDDVEC